MGILEIIEICDRFFLGGEGSVEVLEILDGILDSCRIFICGGGGKFRIYFSLR